MGDPYFSHKSCAAIPPQQTCKVSFETHAKLIKEAIASIGQTNGCTNEFRIKRYLSINYGIPRSDTDVCLRILTDRGNLIRIKYNNGIICYRESKDFQNRGTLLNRPIVSEMITNAVKNLISSTGGDVNKCFLASEIAEAITAIVTDPLKPPPKECRGVRLFESLFLEGKYGSLCVLPDGGYVLDENGDRKRSIWSYLVLTSDQEEEEEQTNINQSTFNDPITVGGGELVSTEDAAPTLPHCGIPSVSQTPASRPEN
ncbi:hypothetical protein ACTXT7_014781 [Hymenolepis weldensis]